MTEEEKLTAFKEQLKEKEKNCKVVYNLPTASHLYGWFVTNDYKLYEYLYVINLSAMKKEEDQRYIKLINNLEANKEAYDKYIADKYNTELKDCPVISNTIPELKTGLAITLNNEAKIKKDGDYYNIAQKMYCTLQANIYTPPKQVERTYMDEIYDEIDRAYPNQENTVNFAIQSKFGIGVPAPLDGITVIDGGDYLHFVTFGLSEPFYDAPKDSKYSGYGIEYTLKLKKPSEEHKEAEINNMLNRLQSFARACREDNDLIKQYDYVYSNDPKGIDAEKKSKITSYITIPDQNLKTLETQNGKIYFVQFIGVTTEEINTIINKELRIENLYAKLPSDITDYGRESVI